MKRTSLMQKIFDESDDLAYVLEQQCKQGAGDCTEERYKIHVWRRYISRTSLSPVWMARRPLNTLSHTVCPGTKKFFRRHNYPLKP